MTGYASVKEPTCGWTNTNEDCNRYGTTNDSTALYNSQIGYLASTTGNISGIYDMSGGAWEYVMGVTTDKKGNPLSGRNSKYNSGFNGPFSCPTCDGDTSGLTELTNGKDFPESKYYDVYSYSLNDKVYSQRILGDATGEMGPFATATYGSQIRKIGSWHNDESWFINSESPWFSRGGEMTVGTGSGIFSFARESGYIYSWYSFRIVLAI